MSEIPQHLKYTASHEWIREESDGTVTIGITDHAQQLLGDMVFVELPQVAQTVQATAEVAVVESVKAASDVYAPLTGTIVAVNEQAVSQPAVVNNDPYGDGWLFKLRPTQSDEMAALLSAAAYATEIGSEESHS